MKYKHLTIEEREKVQELLWQKSSIRTIARVLGRSPSSISREMSRNRCLKRRYTPRVAHTRALEKRTHRGRALRLKSGFIRRYVITGLKAGWSPEQIAGRLSLEYPDHSISYEAIYQYIYSQVHRNGYGFIRPGYHDLRVYLKRRHTRRIPKGARRGKRIKPFIKPSIEDRPDEVETRTITGHWESDTVESYMHRPGINTLVERKTGVVFITRLAAKTSAATSKAIICRLALLPPTVRRTITFDNGSENWDYEQVENVVGIQPFFAHAYASWERGTNENTNGLIRWYFPKGTDFATIADEAIHAVEKSLNTRPRKRLGWRTPLEVFNESVALQG